LIRPRQHAQDSHFRDWVARQNKLQRYYAYLPTVPYGSSAFGITTSWGGGVSAVVQQDAVLTNGFASRSNNRFELVYTGDVSHVFSITCSITSETSVNNTILNVAIAKNGTTLAWTDNDRKIAVAADHGSMSVNAMLRLSPGDLIELRARGDRVANITFEHANLSVVQVD
jgi:hypothetical protein